MSGFYELECTIPIHMHPSRLADIDDGIEEQLQCYLMRYMPDLSGIVLSYRAISKVQGTGRIQNDRPHVHFDVRCAMQVLKILPDTHMVGYVNAVGHDHIALLLHGNFNVEIRKKRIPQSKYTFVSSASSSAGSNSSSGASSSSSSSASSAGVWECTADPSKSIRVRSRVRFRVIRLDTTQGVCRLVGTLDDDRAGTLDDDDDGVVAASSSKRRRDSSSSSNSSSSSSRSISSSGNSNSNGSSSSSSKKKHKKDKGKDSSSKKSKKSDKKKSKKAKVKDEE